MINVKIEQKGSNELDKMIDAFKALAAKEVLVGIPEEKNTTHPGSSNGITNAELLYIHENGSPAKGIPARPVLSASLTQEQDTISNLLGEVAQKVADGETNIDNNLQAVGERAKEIVKNYFGNNLLPDDPKTIKQKGSSTPLVDSGALRESIDYIVKEK